MRGVVRLFGVTGVQSTLADVFTVWDVISLVSGLVIADFPVDRGSSESRTDTYLADVSREVGVWGGVGVIGGVVWKSRMIGVIG